MMKALVVYDSAFGNTERIARAIGRGIEGDVTVRRATEVSASDMEGIDLLVVGSPTQAGRPTRPVQNLVKGVSGTVRVAAFDTRMSGKFARIFGYAADRLAKSLQRKSGTLVAPPEAFYVVDREGPLKDGEMERAVEWGRTLRSSVG